jgi:hypothetical protein
MDNLLTKQESKEGTITYQLLEEELTLNKQLTFGLKDEPEPKKTKNKNKKTSKKNKKENKPIFNVVNKKKQKKENNITNKNNNNNLLNNKNEINHENRTILDIINDTESGIPIAAEKKTTDTANNMNSINKLTQKSGNSANKSRKSSNMSYNTLSNQSDFLNMKLERDRENYKVFKPKLVLGENGVMKIEKPNITEISQKLHEDNLKRNFPYIVDYNESNKITSLSFMKKFHTDKWDKKETEIFYKALECFGTDFSLLEVVLKPRARNQIKNKYRKEEKLNPKRIDIALKKFNPNKLIKLLKIIQNIKQNDLNIDFKKLIMDETIIENDEELHKFINNVMNNNDVKEEKQDTDSEDDSEDEDSENPKKKRNKINIKREPKQQDNKNSININNNIIIGEPRKEEKIIVIINDMENNNNNNVEEKNNNEQPADSSFNFLKNFS